ncbi:MAG: flagellar filament capping protein FliD [Ignavibacteriota bacterium]|nr:flagellar cap protein FliD [Ignavibacteriota bacterium]MBW7841532.1 flagellar filament capping protein FliD [Ignavibacterium sp.]MCO6448249.1 flagellar filament capping protein FliD [Ignavibacterium album]QKK00253.1 MAG: flagellar filament capping protein FliD [Ignavibacteriota bacterium]HOJ06306.1 flagellar filament capping protein FliD [Ignavibacteriaceae bacterium]
MAYDLLTTSGINSLVNSYINSEKSNRISPLETRKTKYTKISNIYSGLLTKVDALKSKMNTLKATGTSSAFAAKKAVSSNTTAVTVSASQSAQRGNFSLRVNQLAKNDLVVSLDKNSNSFSSITAPGTYSFTIKSGDGEGGQFYSNISLNLTESDFTNGNITFDALSKKISKAINDDKAEVLSDSVSGSSISSGTFKVNLNGTETTINYSAGTYEEVIDSVISQLENISGLTAEKVADGSNVKLKFTVTDSSKYISINSDTGSLLSELGISVNKEKGASGVVSAASFYPAAGLSQISLTAKNSGSGFSIEEISDTSGNILSEFGLNLGTNRTAFVQNESGEDTAGFVYNLSSLNAKINFNGLNIERYSNTISDLVTGVTISLKAVMSEDDTDVNIDVTNDVSSVKGKVEEFISAFNDIYTYIKTNSTSVDGVRGILLGDASASSLLNILSSTAYSPVSGLGSGTINSLSKMGITFNTNTGLSITDSSQLTNVLEDNILEVEQLFVSENGVASNLYNKLQPYTGSAGYLTTRKNSLDNNIESINDSITQAQSKIDKRAEALRMQYIQLQSQLSELFASVGNFNSDIWGI